MAVTSDEAIERRRAAARARAKLSQAKRKAAGLCAHCGKPSRPNRVLCSACTTYHSDRKRKEREQMTPAELEAHRERCKLREQARFQRYIAAGLCVRCLAQPRRADRMHCQACMDIIVECNRKRRGTKPRSERAQAESPTCRTQDQKRQPRELVKSLVATKRNRSTVPVHSTTQVSRKRETGRVANGQSTTMVVLFCHEPDPDFWQRRKAEMRAAARSY